MQVVGLDQADQELTLQFNQERCIWGLTKAAKPLLHQESEEIIQKVAAFMTDKTEWTGTASELLGAMQETNMLPHNLTKKLNVNVSVLFNDFGIVYVKNERSANQRSFPLVSLTKSNDAMTLNGAEIRYVAEASERHDAENSDAGTL